MAVASSSRASTRSSVAEFAARARCSSAIRRDLKTWYRLMITRPTTTSVTGYIRIGLFEEGAAFWWLAALGASGSFLPAPGGAGQPVPPTVFADVDYRMRIAQERSFGPVVFT